MTIYLTSTIKSSACGDSLALRSSLGVILRCNLMLFIGDHKLTVLIVRDDYLCLAQILATNFQGLIIILSLLNLISECILIVSIILISLNLIRIIHFDVFMILMSKMVVMVLVAYSSLKI